MGENIGKITQVLGPVVDVEFEQGKCRPSLRR
jgi:F-type H+-transporting ATPase subunit beta